MRVLHVIPSYYPSVRYGGAVLATHGLCTALAAAGHDVQVYTSNRDGDGTLDVPLGEAVDVDGVRVHYHGLDAPRRWYHSSSLSGSLSRNAGSFDLIHGHSLFLHPVDAAAAHARRHHIPFVLSPRGMLVKELFRRKSALAKWLWLWARGRRQIESATALHLTSELEREEARRFGLRLPACAVVPNGITPAAPMSGVRDPHLILFLGRLSWKKGLEVIVEALVGLPRHRLRVVGDDDEGLVPVLGRLAERAGVASRVEFVGPVSVDQRWSEYREAGVFVLPSMSENFANTVLEAMAMACPVVVSPQVGLSREVQRTGAGLVCEPTVTSLASSIRALHSDPLAAGRMGEAGRAAVMARYLWPDVAREMSQAYARILQPGREQAA